MSKLEERENRRKSASIVGSIIGEPAAAAANSAGRGRPKEEGRELKKRISLSVASAQSYKYLINGRAKSYREVEIKGKNAQHSKLHENKEVDKLLINFLWKE